MTLLDKNRQRPSVIFMGKDRRFLARCPRCETTVDVRSQHKNFEPLYVESQQGSEFKHRGPTPRRITVRNSVKQFPATTLIFIEVYRTPDDPGRHKETEHYRQWRDTVADMMAEPRSSVKFTNVYPGDDGWG